MMNMAKKMMFSVSILAICFSFFACAYSPSAKTNMIGAGVILQTNLVPAKDFTSLGLIFVESSATIAPDGKILSGSKITFEMLMREAHKIGADDIINIKTDEIEKNSTVMERSVPSASSYTTAPVNMQVTVRTVDYKANALAIKYK